VASCFNGRLMKTLLVAVCLIGFALTTSSCASESEDESYIAWCAKHLDECPDADLIKMPDEGETPAQCGMPRSYYPWYCDSECNYGMCDGEICTDSDGDGYADSCTERVRYM